MKVQIQKWGNSLALRIPKSFAIESRIEQGSLVDVSLDNGKIVVQPQTEREYTLEELLAGVTKANLHGGVSFGPPVGKEIL